MADLAMAALQGQIAALISEWEHERDERRELRDSMFMDGNRSYQDGFAAGVDRCVQALKALRL